MLFRSGPHRGSGSEGWALGVRGVLPGASGSSLGELMSVSVVVTFASSQPSEVSSCLFRDVLHQRSCPVQGREPRPSSVSPPGLAPMPLLRPQPGRGVRARLHAVALRSLTPTVLVGLFSLFCRVTCVEVRKQRLGWHQRRADCLVSLGLSGRAHLRPPALGVICEGRSCVTERVTFPSNVKEKCSRLSGIF